jgi:GDP-D-mannose 3',5'-epimerase
MNIGQRSGLRDVAWNHVYLCGKFFCNPLVPMYPARIAFVYLRIMDEMKRILVNGAGGFIGGHLVKRLKAEGNWVRAVDIKEHDFSVPPADEFIKGDLCDPEVMKKAVKGIDEVYQLAADMGGAGYIFTGDHDAAVMTNSATINLNALNFGVQAGVKRFFYSSSACIYPEYNQMDPDNPKCSEASAYPAAPDSEYGWEKLFSERLYLSYMRNHGVQVRVARFHNIFGLEGTWQGGKEKSPAALCRKIAECPEGGEIEIWGDGKQTRSFLFIDECVDGVRRLMDSDFTGPVNVGSEEMVTINHLAEIIMGVAGKKVGIKHIPGPLGVRGRNSDNHLIREKLGWAPSKPLRDGLAITYAWIKHQSDLARVSKTAA